ncbi:MAG TPA: CBS domain-containing protein [Pilimelia sp.]|nr:CBS domain-containing protein [Pilimelia sp.]
MKLWQVGDVMTADVVSVAEKTPYRRIVDLMMQRRVSAVPVIDDFRRVVGVVSEADLLHKVELASESLTPRVFESRRHRWARSKARGAVGADLMSAPVLTVLPTTPVAAAARLMDGEQVKRLPVTDDLGRLVGIVTRGDLLKMYLRPDADIRRDVVDEVLRRVLAVEDGMVVVQVREGVVTLTGTLDRWSATDIAVRLSRQVAGVVQVVDRLAFDFDDSNLAAMGAPFGVA